MAITVYDEPVRTRYTANSGGANMLCLFSFATVLIVPFVICANMGMFWPISNTLWRTPTVSYTGKSIVRVDTDAQESFSYVSSAAVMDLLESYPNSGINALYPQFTVLADDIDRDGKVDKFSFGMQLSLAELEERLNVSSVSVTKVCILPELRYQVSWMSLDINAVVAPLLCAVKPQGSGFSDGARIVGELNFYESSLVDASPYVRYDRVYSASLFPSFTAFQLAALYPVAEAYGTRNISVHFEPKLVSYEQYGGLRVGAMNVPQAENTFGLFTLEVELKVNDAVILYIPAWYEMIKVGGVQYLVVAYLVFWLMWFIRMFCVKQALVNTIAIWEGQHRMN